MTRAKDISKIVTDADLSGTLDVTGTVTAGGLTVDGTTADFVVLNYTDDGAGQGPNLFLRRTSASPADNDVLGSLIYQGKDSGGNTTSMAEIKAIATDVTDGSEIASLNLRTRNGSAGQLDRLKIDGNGDISFYEDTGTTPKLFWDASAESLGIGTASPAESISTTGNALVGQDTSSTQSLFFRGSAASTGNASITKVFDSELEIKSSLSVATGKDITFYTDANNERMRIQGGNVGIGTNSPSATLEISNLTSNAAKLRVARSTTQTNYLELGTDGGVSTFTAQGIPSVHGSFAFFTKPSDGTSSERMRIDSNGNVGISNTTPSSFFAGATNLVIGSGSGNEGMTIFSGTSSIGNIKFADGTASDAEKTAGGIRYDHSGNFMRFDTNDGTERMRITSGGNVGIGTSSPDTALDVTGTVTADGLTVSYDRSDTSGGFILYDDNQSENRLTLQTGGGAGVNAVINQSGGSLNINDASLGIIASFSDSGNIEFYEDTGTTAKMTWLSSSEILNLTDGAELRVRETDSSNDAVRLASDVNEGFVQLYHDGSQTVQIRGAGGNYILNTFSVGITSNPVSQSGTTVGGQHFIENGYSVFAVVGGITAYFNRQYNDGPIVEFRQDGTNVGNIGSISGDIFIGTGGTTIRFTGSDIRPTNSVGANQDNILDLGDPSARWDDIYATNGTIQTSDRNEKQDIEELSDAEQRVAVVAKGLMRKFRWIDSVAEKGDNARTHFGIIAQDLQDAFTAEGLDAGDYAMFTSNTWWEKEISVDAVEADEENGIEAQDAYTYIDTKEEATEGYTERTRLGVRYNQLLAFIISAI